MSGRLLECYQVSLKLSEHTGTTLIQGHFIYLCWLMKLHSFYKILGAWNHCICSMRPWYSQFFRSIEEKVRNDCFHRILGGRNTYILGQIHFLRGPRSGWSHRILCPVRWLFLFLNLFILTALSYQAWSPIFKNV